MKLFICLCITLCVATSSLATAPKKSDAQDVKIKQDLKPKREAPLPAGGFHGPSIKYLPPSSGGYDSYSHFGHNHGSSSGFGFGGGYRFSGAELSPHQHVPHSHGGVSFRGGLSGHSDNKVQTYIIQSENAGHGGSSYAPSGHGYSHSIGSGSGGGYRYSSPSVASSFGGISHGSGSFGIGHSRGHASGHGGAHKVQSFVVPSGSFGGKHGVSANLGVGGSSGYHYSPSKGFGSSFSSSSFGGHGSSFGGSGGAHFGGGLNHGEQHIESSAGQSGYHYAPNIGTGFGLGSDDGHAVVEHVSSHEGHGFQGGLGGGSIGGHNGGYEYEAPTVQHIPSTSYGVPSVGAPVAEYSPSFHGSSHSHGSHSGHDDAPTYAAGHKGLGHFGYTASKPYALNTDTIASTRYGGGHDHSTHSISQVPFKPSTFLGATHEVSSSSSHSSGHHVNDYNIPQPPTSSGYDYQPPSVLYGAPSGHGIESNHISVQEPESSYLPPASGSIQPHTSYGPPPAPTSNYLPPGNSYIPPHH